MTPGISHRGVAERWYGGVGVVEGCLVNWGWRGCEWGWRVRHLPRPLFRRARWGRGGRGVSSCWHEGSPTALLDSKGALWSKTFICCHFNIVFFSSICALNFGLMSLLPRIMSSFSSCWAFGHTPYTWYSGKMYLSFFQLREKLFTKHSNIFTQSNATVSERVLTITITIILDKAHN